ncbi:MAG: formate dehydrogenase accessory sulfurtransferase FdhD [Thermodesulfovibrionales bacterium]
MSMNNFEKTVILRIRGQEREHVEDYVAVEKRVRISVNGRYLVSLYCSPDMIREFVAGVVHNEGLISGPWCAERMSIVHGDEITVDIPADGEPSRGERTITSGCAGGISIARKLPDEKNTDPALIPATQVREIYSVFQRKADGYHMTGGVHSAALTDGREILVFAEDIGRHNAVDKVIGSCLLEQIPFAGRMMLASGRLSSEIVTKCARAGIPFAVSRAAPTSLAVKIAAAAGITLVGFVRGGRMNVYSEPQRIGL